MPLAALCMLQGSQEIPRPPMSLYKPNKKRMAWRLVNALSMANIQLDLFKKSKKNRRRFTLVKDASTTKRIGL